MYANDRDQINYHGFLNARRALVDVTLDTLTRGVCSKSEMNRIENGERQGEKLLRDRISARLGVSTEEYEDLLGHEEYRQWQIRMYILKMLDKKDFAEAERGIIDLEAIKRRNHVQKQFTSTMRYQMRKLQGAPVEELLPMLEEALFETVAKKTDKVLAGYHLLSDQEINLLIEYTAIRECPKKKKDPEWRIGQYQSIAKHIDDALMDDIAKSKIYPRLAFDCTKYVLENEGTEEQLNAALEMCEKAIEYLRKANRMYYLIEVLESQSALLSELKPSDYEKTLERNEEWVRVLKELYEEYEIPAYMETFTYLYWESECHNIAEVLEVRRNMYGLSRVKLAGNRCSDKTIVRYERYGVTPNMAIARDLLEDLGLCAEYKRARVITSDSETLYLADKVVDNMNKYEYEAWDRNLRELKYRLNPYIPFNKQEILNEELVLKLERDGLDADAAYEGLMEALESTISFENVERNKIKYLSRSELTTMYNIAFETNGEKAGYCREYIERLCTNILNKDVRMGRVPIYDLLADGLADYLGDVGRYEESTKICEKMMVVCLKNRRMFNLTNYIYHKLWNKQILGEKQGSPLSPQFVKKELEKCLVLSKLNYVTNLIEIFKNKIASLN